MSRIGKMPIAIPAGVTVEVAENNKVTVKGPKGTLVRTLPGEMKISQNDGVITIERPNDQKKEKSLHGLTRSLLHNMVVGVSAGFEKKLEVNGVGYRAAKSGNTLTLSLGYSHPVEMTDPEGVTTEVQGNVITVKGGKIAVTEASCPDHYCMHRGFCDSGLQIVCLPNKLEIRFTGKQDIDGVVG